MLPRASPIILPMPPCAEPDSHGRGRGPSAAIALAGRAGVARFAIEALQDSGYSALRALTVSSEAGQIVLRGQVACYFLKQQAQVVVFQAIQGRTIRNEIDVVPGSDKTGQGGSLLRGAD